MGDNLRSIIGRVWTRPYLLLLPISAFILFFNLDKLCFWGDELYTLELIRSPLTEIIRTVGLDYHPPLYFLLAKYWCNIFGYTETGLRSFSALLGLLGILSSIIFYRFLLDKPQFQLASILISIHPVLLLYCRMGRYYSLLYLFSTISFYFFFKMLQSPRIKYILPYSLAGIGLIYTANTGWFVFAAQSVIYFFISRKRELRPIKWFSILALIIAAYIPWLVPFVNQLTTGSTSPEFHLGAGMLPDLAVRLFYPLYSYLLSETIYPWKYALVIPAVLTLALAGIGIVKSIKVNKDVLICLVGITIPLILMVITSLFVFKRLSFAFFPSRLLYALLFVPPLLSIGLSRFRRTIMLTASIILIAFHIYAGANYFQGRGFHNLSYIAPLREVRRDFIKETLEPEIVVSNIHNPSYYLGGSHTYLDLGLFTIRYGDGPYPASIWFLIKSPDQMQVASQLQKLILSLCQQFNYENVSENRYGLIDANYRYYLSRWTGIEFEPYRLRLIHLRYLKK